MHPSAVATPKYNNGKQPVAASPLECRAVGEITREITLEEIEQFIADYGKAAYRAYQAGFDAIEVHCCHGHGLLGRFISPCGKQAHRQVRRKHGRTPQAAS